MIYYQKTRSLTDLAMTKQLLAGLDQLYPDFEYWYVNNCMPGILMGTDVLMVARDKLQVVGAALGKKGDETKLRCVRVLPEYQNRGVGIHLVEKMLVSLDKDKPHCTVAEEMLHDFSRPFINLFKFELSSVEKGLYRKGKLEYIFNSSNKDAS